MLRDDMSDIGWQDIVEFDFQYMLSRLLQRIAQITSIRKMRKIVGSGYILVHRDPYVCDFLDIGAALKVNHRFRGKKPCHTPDAEAPKQLFARLPEHFSGAPFHNHRQLSGCDRTALLVAAAVRLLLAFQTHPVTAVIIVAHTVLDPFRQPQIVRPDTGIPVIVKIKAVDVISAVCAAVFVPLHNRIQPAAYHLQFIQAAAVFPLVSVYFQFLTSLSTL